MLKDKKPLYRKENINALHHYHHVGPDARHDRNTKNGISRSMKRGKKRGLDYTPLYMFLLSKVGQKWDKVHSEAVSRLDKEEPIYHLVVDLEALKIKHAHYKEHNSHPFLFEHHLSYVRCGESAFYSSLYVDGNGFLQKVDPELKNEHFSPDCPCCTHTFNGKVLVKKYNSERR